MRVLCVTPMAPEPEAPGYGAYVVRLARDLEDLGHDVVVVRRPAGMRGARSYGALLAAGTRRLTSAGRFDVVHGHYLGAAAAVARTLAAGARLPLVLTAHGSDVELCRGAAARMGLGSIVRSCAGLHFVSDYLRGLARERFGPFRGPTLVGSLGIDHRLYPPKVPAQRRPGRLRLLVVASYVPYKGWSTAIDCAARLWEAGRDVELVGVGAGDAAPFAAEASARGIAGRVELTSARPPEAMPSIYAAADVVLAPSHREGLGLVPLEAMACGVPVVCSGVGGMSDYARDGHNALCAPVGDGAAWAAAVTRLAESDALRERLVQGGVQTAAAHDGRARAETIAALLVEAAASRLIRSVSTGRAPATPVARAP